MTMTLRKPRALPTSASPIPVLPAVPSTMTPPGRIRPLASASFTMASAARSLTEPPGFRNSALPRIVQPVSSDALRSLMSGVLPTVSLNPSRMFMVTGVLFLGCEPEGESRQTAPRRARRWRSALKPPPPQIVAVEQQPLQGDQSGAVADLSARHLGLRFGDRNDSHTDILIFMGKTMNAAESAAVDAGAEETAGFAGAAGAGEIVGNGDQLAEFAVGLFLSFAMGDLLGRLAFVDDPGDNLDLPAGHLADQGADAKLLNQQRTVSFRVVGQHGNCMTALKHLAGDLAAPAAGEHAVTEAVAHNTEIPFVGDSPIDELEIFVGHGSHCGLHRLLVA